VAKLLYKPVAILVGLLAGLVATQIFEKVWALIGDGEPADPDDRDAGWSEIVISSIISGAIFGGVRAVIQRGGAKGFERATGIWPGDAKS
jgi:hypothetical protein